MSNVKVVKFYSTTCGPCKQFAPIFDEIQEEFPEFAFSEVCTDDAPFTTAEYQVTTVPTVIVIDGTQELDRVSGIISKPKLRKCLDAYR